MNIEHLTISAGTAIIATIGYGGSYLWAVVAEQPAWVPIVTAVIMGGWHLYASLRDRKLEHARRDNAALAREIQDLRKRLKEKEGVG